MEQAISQMYQSELPKRQVYITDRLEAQVAYYDSRSSKNKKIYYNLSILAIVVNAMIPVLSLYLNTPDTLIRLGITCLSSLTAIITSCLMVLNSKELWLKYRKNAARLESLLHQYYAGTGIFEGMGEEEAFKLLVRRSEEEMLEENEDWSALFVRENNGIGKKGA